MISIQGMRRERNKLKRGAGKEDEKKREKDEEQRKIAKTIKCWRKRVK